MKRWSTILGITGLIAIAYCGWVYFQAARYQAAEKSRLASGAVVGKAADTEVHSRVPPEAHTQERPKRGEAVALLTIPRLNLSAVVVQGAGARELKLGLGHIRSTPLPGEGGNTAIAGHRDTFFRPLRHIRRGDVVQVKTSGREFRYRVVATKIVAPREVQVLDPTGQETLTLITCYPFDIVGRAPKRFIVRADAERDFQPAPPGQVQTSPLP